MKRTAGSSSRQERERVREERNEEAEDLMVRSQRRFAEYQRARKELKLSHADALRHAADAVEAVNVKPFERPLPPAAKRPKRSPAVPSMRSKCPLCTVVVPARSKDGLDEHVSMCLEARDKLMQLGFDEQQVKAALKAGNTRACASAPYARRCTERGVLDDRVSMCLEARDKLMQLRFDEQQVKRRP
eukprot:gene2638-4090_t